MKLGSPPLSFEHEALWPMVKQAWCAVNTFKKSHSLADKANIGLQFCDELNLVLKRLGCHYNGPSKHKNRDASKSDPAAFSKFFLRIAEQTFEPRAATSVTL